MVTVGDMMTQSLVTLREVDSLQSADEWLELGHIRHLPVVRGRKLVGLITHRDLLRQCHQLDAGPGKQRLAREVMTREVTTVRPETPLRDAIRLMLSNKFGCLPVTTDDDTLVGIITESDLLRMAERHLTDLHLPEDAASNDR